VGLNQIHVARCAAITTRSSPSCIRSRHTARRHASGRRSARRSARTPSPRSMQARTAAGEQGGTRPAWQGRT
jgi:hypothetical protein